MPPPNPWNFPVTEFRPAPLPTFGPVFVPPQPRLPSYAQPMPQFSGYVPAAPEAPSSFAQYIAAIQARPNISPDAFDYPSRDQGGDAAALLFLLMLPFL